MGTPGVPFNIPKEVILEAIKTRKGVITHICKDLSSAHGTLIKHINADSDLKAALDAARHEYDDILCDVAEGTMLYTAGQREDLSAAISACKFVLNNKGKKRGYTPPNYKEPTTEGDIDEVRGAVQTIDSNSRDKFVSGPELAPTSSLLHQGQPRQQGPIQAELGAEDPLAGFTPV